MTARPSANPNRAKPTFGSRTDIGCLRDHNEDSLVVEPPLYAVADGMGGHAAGEVASEIAVRTLSDAINAHSDTNALINAVIEANHAVISAARKKGRAGMGTTLTAALLHEDRLSIAQVGDSRAYLLHQGKMQQITRDHSLMADMIELGEITPEEAKVHPKRSVITRALGSDPGMQPDVYEINVSAGDRLLLCSDGLSSMLDDEAIEHVLVRTRDPQRAASILVNDAIAEGGHDNITVIVLDIEGNAKKEARKTQRRGRMGAVFIALLALAVVGAIGYGAYTYSQSTAYLAVQDGKVAVYQGVPDSIFGFELSHLDHVTDIDVEKLQPGVAKRLGEGVIRVDSLDAAERLVEEYRADIEKGLR